MATWTRFTPSVRFLPLAFTIMIMFALAILAPLGSPARAERGQWTPLNQLYPWGGAIHLALVRSDGNPHHSRVISWAGGGAVRVFGWQPGSDGCTNWPTSSFTSLGISAAPAEIFCAGQAQLATGRLMTVGGDAGPNWGIRDAVIRTGDAGSGAGSWTALSAMKQPRWYPTITALKDGRGLVHAGVKYEHMWLWGGKRGGMPPASATGHQLHRFGRLEGGAWDPSVTPLADQQSSQLPVPRQGHAIAYLADRGQQAMFGGTDSVGGLIDDEVWLLKREDGAPLDAEYTYRWEKLQLEASSPRPSNRSEHAAVATDFDRIAIFGGLGKAAVGQADTVLSDLWVLRRNPLNQQWRWDLVQILYGTPPARYGHTAAYAGPGLMVFGGAEAPGEEPQDSRVHVFEFSSATSGGWSVLEMSGTSPVPQPRLDHAMVVNEHSGDAYLYSGRLRENQSSDTLWSLRYSEGPARWMTLPTTGQSPGPRSGHSAAFKSGDTGLERRILVFGGETLSGAQSDRYVYSIDPAIDVPNAWTRWQENPFHLSQHTACLDEGGAVHARIPEIFSPTSETTGTWSEHPNASWLQPATYPLHFLVPGTTIPSGGGRVVAVGQEPQTRYLDIPADGLQAGSWQDISGGNVGFRPLTGVEYEPGKIVVAGGSGLTGGTVGTTKTLDMNTMSGWQDRASMSSRFYHNLVVLPTGEVLATGGLSSATGGVANLVRCPQLWDPNAYTWTDTSNTMTRLACDDVVRDYHSTALLLPDARVLTGGGEASPDKDKARIFCPPYLFNSDGSLAIRPSIGGAPQRVRYGAQFSVCLNSAGTISKACLIRPGATTHAFDQNQRYVPLTFAQQYSPARLIATAPADSSAAPPGDYLLFVLNAQEVPSIARWVRMGFSWSEGDVTSPDSIALFADFIADTAVNLTWVAPGDDHATGTASYLELRRSFFPIVSSTDWEGATQVTPRPVPGCGGIGQQYLVIGLQGNKTYYFAIKASDESENYSPIGRLKVTTLGQCCSGEARARLASEEPSPGGSASRLRPDESAGAASMRERPVPTSAALAAGAAGFIVEAAPSPGGLDVRMSAIEGDSYAGEALASGGGVLLQSPDGSGGWKTELHYGLPPGNRFAICAPNRPTRWVILEPCALQQVLPSVDATGSTWQLDGLFLKHAGSVSGTPAAPTSPPALLSGDVLEAHYANLPTTAAAPPAWLALLNRSSGTTAPSRADRRPREVVSAPPTRFALHQNQPNPFSESTTIGFDLPVGAVVKLEVLDLLGRHVAMLANHYYPAGYHVVSWDKRDNTGALVVPGAYFNRIEAGARLDRKRMIVLR